MVSLAPGTYTATVALAAAGAANSPRHIQVTFTVSLPPEGPALQNPAVSSDAVALTWTFDWPGGLGSSNDRYLLEESTTSASSGFTQIAQYASHDSPFSVTLDQAPGTYYYRVRARTNFGLTAYSQVRTAVVNAATRQLRIINNASSGQLADTVVRLKIIPAGSYYSDADLLTQDNGCWDLPGDNLPPGSSQTFEVTVGAEYLVFIGLGTWECDATGLNCPLSRCWWERYYFTTQSWENFYPWVEVHVTGHESGAWDWEISGSYLNGNQYLTPAGNSPIPFRFTQNDPIAGKSGMDEPAPRVVCNGNR
ncbi:MAG: hypothetical protein ABIF77_07850 [bacterium]